jgi:integration host factor subunit beta
VNRADLVEKFRAETGLTKAKAEQVIDLLFDEMSEALATGDRVEIRGLCSLHVKEYEGYTGRNPKTRALTEVAAKKLPFFKAGKELKERVDKKKSKQQAGKR